MIVINEDVVDARSTFFKNRLMGVKKDVENGFVKQSEVEDEVLRLSKILDKAIFKFRYNLNPYPHALTRMRRDISMLGQLDSFILGCEYNKLEDWDEDDLEVAISIYPHIDKIKRDLKWIQNERKKIREVAKTAPAGEKYAYDKCRGELHSGLNISIDTLLSGLDNIKKELNKHKELLKK